MEIRAHIGLSCGYKNVGPEIHGLCQFETGIFLQICDRFLCTFGFFDTSI